MNVLAALCGEGRSIWIFRGVLFLEDEDSASPKELQLRSGFSTANQSPINVIQQIYQFSPAVRQLNRPSE